MAIDRFDWHYDDALKGYCEREKKDPKTLTETETEEVCRYASAHIGLFIDWLYAHDYFGAESDTESAQLVKEHKMTGTDYLMNCCDGKFWDVDVDERLHPFIEDFYNDYLGAFDEILEALDKDCYGFIEAESDYPAAEKVLDRLFEKYKDRL